MRISAITFDYFGTLVDVDNGGISGMRDVLVRLQQPQDAAARLYLAWDQKTVQTYRGSAYRSYRAVAADALAATLRSDGIGFPESAVGELTDILLTGLVERAAPYPDTRPVLEKLADKYRLMPITNMDSDLFRRSQLAGFFPEVITAEMAQAYKPSERIFRLALDRLALRPDQVLHASLASWADIDGAKPLGMTVAWINRGAEELSPWQPRPDFELPNLIELPEIIKTRMRGN